MNLPYANTKASITFIDPTTLENEINSKFANNPNYDINDIQILAEVTQYSFVPIKSTVDSTGNIRIENSLSAVGMNLYVCSKHQFLHKQMAIEEDSHKVELDEYFKTAWNNKKFLIFQDGYLMNNNLFTFIFPGFDNTYLKKIIYSTAIFKKGSRLDIYYIESDDNFNVPISRDIYLGAVKYVAKKNHERVIVIPYPNENCKSFFIFNENGEYLDKKTDYVISYDGKYITLSEEQALKLGNVNYIIFSFPIVTLSAEMVQSEIPEDTTLKGNPLFRYCYSLPSNDDQSGLVRFSPIFTDYNLAKKNFLLFGNGEWIHPSRFSINSNDSILFKDEEDKRISSFINYTMVILDDNTDHTEHQIPGEYRLVKVEVKNEQSVFYLEQYKIPDRYRSFIIFSNNYIVNPEEYEYDETRKRLEFIENPISNDFYILFTSSLVNNTNQEALVFAFSFPCIRFIGTGSPIPAEYVNQNWNKENFMLFLNGAFLEPGLYEIRDGKIYLDESFYKDENGNLLNLAGYEFSIVYIVGMYKQNQEMVDDLESIKNQNKQISNDYLGGAIFNKRESIRTEEHGVIRLEDKFANYNLTKKNFLLFNKAGLWIDPSRFEIANNDVLYFNNDDDHRRSPYTSYSMIVLDDSKKDDLYNPPSYLIKQVIAEYDEQSVFNIPDVHRRYETFILFKGGMLLSRDYRYEIDNENGVIRLLHEEDFIQEGRTLTFVFLDSFSRQGQENQFIQANFECTAPDTEIPANFFASRFDEKNVCLFLNGLYLDPSKYSIHNNHILLDGYLEVDWFANHVYTILYITTLPIILQDYSYILPSSPNVPIKPYNNTGNSYWNKYFSDKSSGKIVKVEPAFSDYSLTKQNIMLFKDGIWMHPDDFVMYSNDTIILKESGEGIYSMVVFNDPTIREVTSTPLSTKTIDVLVEGKEVTIPNPGEAYRSFVIFEDGKLVNLDSLDIDMENRVITLAEDDNTIWSFVFLHAHMNTKQQTLMIQENFKYNGIDTQIPRSIFTENTLSPKYFILFADGRFLDKDEYLIVGNDKLTIFNHNNIKNLTAVYLISLVDEDYEDDSEIEYPDVGIIDGFHVTYSYSNEINLEDRTSSGIVTFDPIFTEYTLDKRNFLLFANGIWISPDRYTVHTNSIISFDHRKDQIHSDWTHYTMAILNEGSVESEEYTPVNVTVFPITATEMMQRMFIIPEMNEHSSYLVFLGSLLLPIYNEDRVYINKEENKLILLNQDDYVEKGRSLYFVILNDSSASDRRYPSFVQETFKAELDPSRGTKIPSDWYNYENHMMLFLGGMYLDQSRYEIRDHKIYLTGNFSEMDNPYSTGFIKQRSYTAVYLAANILEDYEEIAIVPEIQENTVPTGSTRELPSDDIPDSEDYIFEYHTSETNGEYNRGYIQFLDKFNGYDLTSNNFLLFANSTWIDPARYQVLGNDTIQFLSPSDKYHSDWTHYTMIIPYSQQANDTYKNSYTKINFKIVEIVTERDTDELELPTVEDDYQSLLIFRNSLILPIYDEDRFVIDEANHKFMILNKEDWIPEFTKVSFVYMSSLTNSDRKVFLSQESFSCFGLETLIPKTMYQYDNQIFYKSRMILFLNGTFMDPSRYRIHNNTIYLVDEIPIKNDHYFTMVYINTFDTEESYTVDNLIDETYSEEFDDIIFEDAYATPYQV